MMMMCIERHPLYGIVWKSEEQSQLSELDQIVNAHRLRCHVCRRKLSTIGAIETWYYRASRRHYFCSFCYAKFNTGEEESNEFTLSCEEEEEENIYDYCDSVLKVVHDRKDKIPCRLTLVAHEIENHPHFRALDPITKMHYAECVVTPKHEKSEHRQREDNQFLRSLWKTLYVY